VRRPASLLPCSRYRALEIALCDTDVQAQFDLALRYRISAFGAAYLCLAAELHSPLATFDPQLAEAARVHLSSLD
jgi:predicted nucleic acid-binding protein